MTIEIPPFVYRKCQTPGYKAYEYLENIHIIRKKESKTHVTKRAKGTSVQ